MVIQGDSIDDILIELYKIIQKNGTPNEGNRGDTIELLGVTLRLKNPRSRLSRSKSRGKIFSAIGELLWYLTGDNKLSFIQPYIAAYKDDADKDGKIHGGYGPRLFSMHGSINQIENVLKLLKDHPKTRRAVIQLFDARDIATHHKEIPCTTTLQFFVRENYLHMAVTMRSNDAYLGLPHDIFCFTMLQEMVATALHLDVGEYIHFAGSMHIYTTPKNYLKKAKKYVEEGYQRIDAMPAMPSVDPFKLVPLLLEMEEKTRRGEWIETGNAMPPYWADILRLVQAFWAKPHKRQERIEQLEGEVGKLLKPYIKNRKKSSRPVS